LELAPSGVRSFLFPGIEVKEEDSVQGWRVSGVELDGDEMEVVVVGIGGEDVAIERWKETRRRVADVMMRFAD
jgi:hypothetical protein